MTQDKMRKIITAGVAAATLLLVFLFSFLVYQGISIAILNKKIADQKAENQRYEEIIEQKKYDAEYYESVFGKEWLAFQEGFVRPEK